nr:hypothetical protein CFP56_24899 [Quercus suber]
MDRTENFIRTRRTIEKGIVIEIIFFCFELERRRRQLEHRMVIIRAVEIKARITTLPVFESERKSDGWAMVSTPSFRTPIVAFSKVYDEKHKQQ